MGQILGFSLGIRCRFYNTVALLCECVCVCDKTLPECLHLSAVLVMYVHLCKFLELLNDILQIH